MNLANSITSKLKLLHTDLIVGKAMFPDKIGAADLPKALKEINLQIFLRSLACHCVLIYTVSLTHPLFHVTKCNLSHFICTHIIIYTTQIYCGRWLRLDSGQGLG